MIYFIQQGVDGPVKIGFSKTARGVSSRRNAMQTAHCVELRVLRIMDGDREDEAALHWALAEWRIRGEWFSPSEDVLRVAICPFAGGDLLDGASCWRRWERWGLVDGKHQFTDRGFDYLRALERQLAPRENLQGLLDRCRPAA